MTIDTSGIGAAPTLSTSTGTKAPYNPYLLPQGVQGTYVGVPTGSYIAVGGPGNYRFVPGSQLRYYKGDEWAPLNGDENTVRQLQQALINSGYLKATTVVYGVWGTASADAFAKLLGESNLAGKDWRDLMSSQLKAGGAASKSQRAPLEIRLTNPDDLRTILNNTAKTLYGGNLPPADVEAFIRTYQQMQSTAQTNAYNTASGGGTVTDPADPSVVAEQYIREKHPVEVGTQGFVNAMDSILGTFTKTPAGAGNVG